MLEKNLSKTSSILPELNVRTELDHAFHQIISELAGNQEINKILTNNYDHLLRTLRHLNSEPERRNFIKIIEIF
ncbi:FCD domain-containing protein [Salibacterium salarium]|uniref:FCD domain-containing protein n=1 Tax=Salibacterium salarium TaxID=284579 RepID=A0A3R9P6C4_9BACI|nr:FCD domain-containing protein [Salibacterium salarium]